jgi:isochorismate synthase
MLAVLGIIDETLIDSLVVHAARIGVVHAEHSSSMYGFGDAQPPLSGSLLDEEFRALIFSRLSTVESNLRSIRAHIAAPFDLRESATVRIPKIQVTLSQGVASVVVLGATEHDARASYQDFVRELELVAPLRGDPEVLSVSEEPPSPDYARAVALATSRFDANFDKVVLARSLRVHLSASADPASILASMALREPFCTRYAHSLEGRRFVGASPELLIRRSGSHFSSQPLAGTASARALVEELIDSRKDNAEHRIVVEEIVERLNPLAETLEYPSYPEVLALRSVIHLATRITGTIADPATTALDLLASICPTPAVSGRPMDTALELIKELEPQERGFFAGAMGWVDAAGNGAFVLAIRGVFVGERDLLATAGAGIVAGSLPQAEVAETEMKLRSVLEAAAPGAALHLF